jgi:hypothetical protein
LRASIPGDFTPVFVDLSLTAASNGNGERPRLAGRVRRPAERCFKGKFDCKLTSHLFASMPCLRVKLYESGPSGHTKTNIGGMRSQIKSYVWRDLYVALAIVLGALTILCVKKLTVFGNVVIAFILCVSAFSLIRSLLLAGRLAKGSIILEEKRFFTASGGSFQLPIPEKTIKIWLLIMGPVGRLKGTVTCATDAGDEIGQLSFEDYKRRSRSGYGSIIREFRLYRAGEIQTVRFLNTTLDFQPRNGDSEGNCSVTLLCLLQGS